MGVQEEAEKAFKLQAKNILGDPALGKTYGKMWGSGGELFAPDTFRALQELVGARGVLGKDNPVASQFMNADVTFQPLSPGDFSEFGPGLRGMTAKNPAVTMTRQGRFVGISPGSVDMYLQQTGGKVPLALAAHEMSHVGQPGNMSEIKDRASEILPDNEYLKARRMLNAWGTGIDELEPQLVEHQLLEALKKRGIDLPVSQGMSDSNVIHGLGIDLSAVKNVVPTEFVDTVMGILKKFPGSLISYAGPAMDIANLLTSFQTFKDREGTEPTSLQLYMESVGQNPVTSQQKMDQSLAMGGT